MYAYVSYVGTNERDIVPVSNIKHFDKKNHNPRKKYKIKWQDKWYYGTVAFFGDTEEGVQEEAEKHRPKVIPESILISNTDEDSDDNKLLKVSSKNSKLCDAVLKKRIEQLKLKQSTQSDDLVKGNSTDWENGLEKELTSSDDPYSDKCGENIVNNHKENGADKINLKNNTENENFNLTDVDEFDSSSNDSKNSNKNNLRVSKDKNANYYSRTKKLKPQEDIENKNLITKLQKEIKMLKIKNEKFKTKNCELTQMLNESQDLNFNLQKEVINSVNEMKIQISQLTNRSIVLPRDDEELGPPEIGFNRQSDNHIHLGRNIWVPKEIYETISFSSKSPSMFVKQMALAVFGVKTLKNSSLTGRVSNRKKKDANCPPARPKLDTTKLLAIEDIFKYWLTTVKKTDSVTCNIEITKMPSYITKKISQLNYIPPPTSSKNMELASETSEEEVEGEIR